MPLSLGVVCALAVEAPPQSVAGLKLAYMCISTLHPALSRSELYRKAG